MDDIYLVYATGAVHLAVFSRPCGQRLVRSVCSCVAVPGRLPAGLCYPGDVVPRLGRAHPGEGTGRVRQLSCPLGAFVVSVCLSARTRTIAERSIARSAARVVARRGQRVEPTTDSLGVIPPGMVLRSGVDSQEAVSAEGTLLLSFPFVMMVAGVMLIVTGRSLTNSRPQFLTAGLIVSGAYVLIWMFNGKRSHSLIGVLATVCAFYIARLKRPSWPVLLATGFAGSLVVAIAIGWRGNLDYERSFTGFMNYLGDFKVSKILESLNVSKGEDDDENVSHETTEYGGFLLMMDTVPQKSGFDYGKNYIRVFSTFIPRILWPGKPLYGRAQWVSAWMAGSELERDEDFTGPAIGILGATQLNGGAVATLIVLACVALASAAAYEYFRPRRCTLGPVLVVDHLLQLLVHGGRRRSDDLVLLQLGVLDVSTRHRCLVCEPGLGPNAAQPGHNGRGVI